ncbi:glycosyltransferase family 2 protein [Agrobacterium sp. rho-8.1]
MAALHGLDFEIIAVDDGSRDSTGSVLTALEAADPRIRVVRHARTVGQSSAIRTGVRAASHHWVETLDGDGQNPPD